MRVSYLRYLQHLRVESVEVEHELSQTNERQLDGEHLSESPVIGGVGERVESPLLQHAARNHVALHLFQNVSQDLVADGVEVSWAGSSLVNTTIIITSIRGYSETSEPG